MSRRNLLLGALGLVVVVVTFAVVLPKIASYQHVWDVVRTLDTAWLVALAVALVSIYVPVIVSGTDPTQVPIGAVVAPIAGAIATGAVSEMFVTAPRR